MAGGGRIGGAWHALRYRFSPSYRKRYDRWMRECLRVMAKDIARLSLRVKVEPEEPPPPAAASDAN